MEAIHTEMLRLRLEIKSSESKFSSFFYAPKNLTLRIHHLKLKYAVQSPSEDDRPETRDSQTFKKINIFFY